MDRLWIRGEYWIDNGHVRFADGDVGDEDHESIALEEVVSNYTDGIYEIAKRLKLKVKREIPAYEITQLMMQIRDKIKDREIQRELGADNDAYAIICGGGDAPKYLKVHFGWIAIRENSIDLYGYDENKRKSLASGLDEILSNEGFDEVADVEEMDFMLYDLKTGRTSNLTLADITNPQIIPRPAGPALNQGDRRFPTPNEDKPLNVPVPKTNQWKDAFQKIGAYKGTSENFSFKEWLLN